MKTIWFLTMFSILMICFSAQAEETDWSWYEAVNLIDKWGFVQGSAAVDLRGGKLSAKLYGTDGQKVVITITGTVKDGKISATAVAMDSDEGPLKLFGTYKKNNCEGLDKCKEVLSIMLMNGWTSIGLAKRVVPTK